MACTCQLLFHRSHQGEQLQVHEQLLAGRVGLPHSRRDPVAPFDVEIAESAVAVAVEMMAAIFLPQQRQRHAAAAQLVDAGILVIADRARRDRLFLARAVLDIFDRFQPMPARG